MKQIRYLGNKPCKRDTVASTGLVWQPEETLAVEDTAAAKLLQYPSIWAEAEVKAAPKKAAPKKAVVADEPSEG